MKRGRRTRLATIAAALGALACSATADAAHGATVFRGAFQCDDGRPVTGVRVELWQWEYTSLPKVGPNATMRAAMHADANGAWGFRVSGDETNWFVRVVLSSAETEVRDWLFPWNWSADTDPNQNDVPVQDYGTQRVPGYQCKLWNGFRDAVIDYQSETGTRPPQGEVVVHAGAPTAGRPFARYDVVHWPSDRAIDSSRAKHELAHTVRHVFDGDPVHFLIDAGLLGYARYHDGGSCDPTNAGFAFNEGWAQYWAGTALNPCPNPGDQRVERNVAAGLERIERMCGVSRREMLQVLIVNPGRIHSLLEFARAMACRGPLPVIRGGRRGLDRRALMDRELKDRLRRGRRWLTDTDRLIDRLRAERRSAMRLAERPVPCPVLPCAEQARRILRPVLLAGQLQQTRAVRNSFAFAGSPARLRRLVAAPLAKQMRRLETRRTAVLGRIAGIGSRTMQSASRVVARLGGGELISRALAALAQGRDAAARGDAAALQALAPVTARRLRVVGATPSDAPILDTTAPAQPPTATSTVEIALTCDGTMLWMPSGDPYVARVRGRLLPAQAGSAVRVTHRRFSGDVPIEPLVHSVITDADGWWEDAVTVTDWGAGYGTRWEIQASFEGDATRLPAASGVCTVRPHYP